MQQPEGVYAVKIDLAGKLKKAYHALFVSRTSMWLCKSERKWFGGGGAPGMRLQRGYVEGMDTEVWHFVLALHLSGPFFIVLD